MGTRARWVGDSRIFFINTFEHVYKRRGVLNCLIKHGKKKYFFLFNFSLNFQKKLLGHPVPHLYVQFTGCPTTRCSL